MITRDQLMTERTRHEAAIGVIDDLLRKFGSSHPTVTTAAPAEKPKRPRGPGRGNYTRKPRTESPAPTMETTSTTEPTTEQPYQTKTDQRRLQALKALADGPMAYQQLADKTDIPRGSLWALLQHNWFEKNADNQWTLTEHGRQALKD